MRHYTFIDNTLRDVPFFSEAERMKKYNLSTAAARKKNTSRGLPSPVALRSLHSKFGVEMKEEGRRKESLFKGLRS